MAGYFFLLGIIALSIYFVVETVHEFHAIRDHPERFPYIFRH